MVKLSISLPNNTQITLESEEPDVIQDVLGMLLRGVPLDAKFASVETINIDNGGDETGEKSTDADSGQTEQTRVPSSRRESIAASRQGSDGASAGLGSRIQPSQPALNGTSASIAGSDGSDSGMDLERQPRQAREDYTAFCQSLNPMGDMRRVVVAAEAASRFFGLEGVSADDLGELFDLAGWRRANSFTQTLRNAARSKFGWLERIPGRSGRYAATDLGRSTTLAG
jgi:hypothetical protein